MTSHIDVKNSVLASSPDTPEAKYSANKPSRARSVIFSLLASLGIFGGVSALFIGLAFVAVHGVLSADTIFNKVGTGLLIVAIPMILLGSIFLDEIEGKND